MAPNWNLMAAMAPRAGGRTGWPRCNQSKRTDGPSCDSTDPSSAGHPLFRAMMAALWTTTLSRCKRRQHEGNATSYWEPSCPKIWPTMPFNDSSCISPVTRTKEPTPSAKPCSAPIAKTEWCAGSNACLKCCPACCNTCPTVVHDGSADTATLLPSWCVTITGAANACAAWACSASALACGGCQKACTHGPSSATNACGSASNWRS
mmetsp:Transcript_52701/g.160191  ORF Transcript_52701/g.160191 Transcript_52701/m.160191 type:complete len:206 (-) Transcript_52701:392-1009(-)